MSSPITTVRTVAAVAATSLLLVACTSAPAPQPVSAPVVRGANVSAAMLGPVLNTRRVRVQATSAASIGPVPSGGVVAYMDRQERDLRARTADTGVEVVRQGQNIDLRMTSGITFDFNASTVKAQFRTTMIAIAQTLAAYPSTFVDVAGFTDSLGTDPVNQALSDQRAAAVADNLARLGVNRARIATKGYGKAQPIASNADEAGRARNRRVEIHISPIVEDDVRGRY
ncbi:OmpA family protein [Sphingosinicellaceae bacterium]|nr:OmpA family protein [Sphingosinicellaceae bacterium]